MTSPLRNVISASIATGAWLFAATLACAEAGSVEPGVAAPAGVVGTMAEELSGAAAASEAAAGPVQLGAGSSAKSRPIAVIAPAEPDRWRLSGGPYLWLADMKASLRLSTPSGPSLGAELDLDQGDVLRALQFTVMGAAEARRGRLAAFTDFIYLDIAPSGAFSRSVTGPSGREVTSDASEKASLTASVWTLASGYDIARGDLGYLQLFAGFRYLSANVKLDWRFQAPLDDLAQTGRATGHADLWDGIAGARGEVALGASRWKLIYYGDVGGGASPLTWQIASQLAYVWPWGHVGLGWRRLAYEQSRDNVIQDLSMSGPMMTVLFRFGA